MVSGGCSFRWRTFVGTNWPKALPFFLCIFVNFAKVSLIHTACLSPYLAAHHTACLHTHPLPCTLTASASLLLSQWLELMYTHARAHARTSTHAQQARASMHASTALSVSCSHSLTAPPHAQMVKKEARSKEVVSREYTVSVCVCVCAACVLVFVHARSTAALP